MGNRIEVIGSAVALVGLLSAGVLTWHAMPGPPPCSPRVLGGCGILDVGLSGLWRAALRMVAATGAAVLGALPGLLIAMWAIGRRPDPESPQKLDDLAEQRELPFTGLNDDDRAA